MRHSLTFPLFLVVLLVLTCIGFSLSSSLVSNAAETARTKSEKTGKPATAKKGPSTANTGPKGGPKRRQKPEQSGKTLSKSLSTAAKGVTVRYPDGWSATRSGNLDILFNVSADRLSTLDARARFKVTHITIFTERRKDHAEAVRRLKDIDAEASSPSTFLNIGGWPALQRQQLQPRPQAGQESSAADDSEMILVVTTAVAAGNLLVRLEAWLPSNASPEVMDEVHVIGRGLSFATTGPPAQVEEEIQRLLESSRPRSSSPAQGSQMPNSYEPMEAVSEDSAGLSAAVTQQAGTDSELELAVSPNGRNIVIGSNNGYFFSTNGGQAWNNSTGLGNNDPSVGWGQSGGANGTFYAANIATPSTAISVSTDNGQNFAFRANAFTCQGMPPSCGGFGFPDQEHIAVDRFNVAAGGDQVYSVWRQGGGSWGIVCSQDSGNTWTTAANAVFTGGDFPRITVGQDGFVYVVYLSGDNVMLSKFNSCQANQNPMVKAIADQPVVTGITHVGCPTPGLDRCNFRNTLASPMAAVDDTNANHIYVAYAINTNPGGGGFPNLTNPQQNTANENIVIQDSTDGGSTWNAASPNRTVTVSTGVTARRFMPWVCSVGGIANVTWYDRRAASPGGTTVSNNSLTDFFGASAFLNPSGNLTAGKEFRVNDPGTADTQCEAGFVTGNVGSWPAPVDNRNDSESCSVQPQIGGICCIAGEIDGSGRCLNPTAASGQQRCDFDMTACPLSPGGAAQTCAARRGTPKYGDYNGSACAAGRFYMAWASATAPPYLPAPTNIDAFFSSKIVCCVGQIQIPGNVTFSDTCVNTTSTATLNVCNTGKEDLEVSSIASDNTEFSVTTPSAGFPVVLSPDFCFPFQVRFTPTSTGAKTATLTVNSNDPVNPTVTVQASGSGTQQRISTLIADNGNFGDVCVGSFKDLDLTISNSGGCDLSISNITSSSSQFQVGATMTFPVVIGHGDNIQVPIRFQPTSLGAKTGTITITSNDPLTPSKQVTVSGNAPPGDIRVTGSTTFGDVCVGTVAEKTVSICNVGACDLHVTSVSLGSCADFQLVNNPFPATVSHDSCLDVVIRFTPTSPGPKTCTLTITSDDPDTPVITLPVTANTPAASIDVPLDQNFPPEVIQSVGACSTSRTFPISNTGTCNLTITNITIGGTNGSDFDLSGLPSFPIILEPGHTVGDGDLRTLFAPTEIDRDRLGTLTVTYVSNPVSGATTDVTRNLCGEGVRTGARVLVTHAGVPVPVVEKLQIQRINGNRNKKLVDTVDNAMNLPLVTVTPSLPCVPFRYHREYGTVSNPIQLLPGSYLVTATAVINGRRTSLTVAFNVDTCDFNPKIVVNFP